MVRLAVALGLLLTAACGGGADATEPAAGPTQRQAGTAGVSVQLPAGWRQTRALSGAVTDPVVRLAVSSGPIGPGSSACQVSSYDFPEDEVALVVVEWTTPALLQGTGAMPRPERFDGGSLPIRKPPAIECFPGSGGSAQFVEAGRLFGAYVLLGRKAPVDLADEARAVLDLLRIDMRPARPVALAALADERVADCRRSALLRAICPTRTPLVRAPYLSHLSQDVLGRLGPLDVFDLQRGAEDPASPERNRPPKMVHIGILAGDTERIAPWVEPWRERAVALRDGLMKPNRAEPLSFGLVDWGTTRGLLFLAPPHPTGGYLGNHLVFVSKDDQPRRALSLHAWEPLTEAAATLRAMVMSAAKTSSAPRPSNLLVALPSLGTASWRCTGEEDRYQLGFRVFKNGATTDLRLVVGSQTVARARVDPGRSPRLPVAGLSQRLVLTQSTGAGTVRATVDVRFFHRPVVSHCNRYSPPALRVEVSPRR